LGGDFVIGVGLETAKQTPVIKLHGYTFTLNHRKLIAAQLPT